MSNRKPEPGDGPDYHADLQAWEERQRKAQYTPKVGDRVRVTHVYEGEVTIAGREGFAILAFDRRGGGRSFYYNPDGRELQSQTVEKLQDPEPTWVNGDVVRRTYANDLEPLVRIKDEWRTVNHKLPLADRELSRSWGNGDVEILYKHDAHIAA